MRYILAKSGVKRFPFDPLKVFEANNELSRLESCTITFPGFNMKILVNLLMGINSEPQWSAAWDARKTAVLLKKRRGLSHLRLVHEVNTHT